jgi:hypothetical protein
VPIKATAGLRDGIEIFPRQDLLHPDEFGNALRGPLGAHRANCHPYWFYDAASNLDAQLAYLKHAKKITEEDLQRFTAGMTILEEFSRGRRRSRSPPHRSTQTARNSAFWIT